MINKPFDAITEADISNLLITETSEDRSLDFKLELYKKHENIEISKDISAMANAGGGDIILGIAEQRDERGRPTGIPESIPGIEGLNVDAEKLRIQAIADAHISPRIPWIRYRGITRTDANPVFMIRVPHTQFGPHMVTSDCNRFYIRAASSTVTMDWIQIRDAFGLAGVAAENMESFRADRVRHREMGQVPFHLDGGATLYLHILPLQSFDRTGSVDVIPGLRDQHVAPLLAEGMSYIGYNIDGHIGTTRGREFQTRSTITQIFRNGSVEYIDTLLLRAGPNGQKIVYPNSVGNTILEVLGRYQALIRYVGIAPPLVIMVTLIEVKDYQLPRYAQTGHPAAIDRDVVRLPEIILEDYTFGPELAKTLRPMFDALANAAGAPASVEYDSEGHWTGDIPPSRWVNFE